MAGRALTPQEGYLIINEVFSQATGQKQLATIDTSNFVSVGQTILNTGMENVFNAMSIVLNRLIIKARPYKAKLSLMDAPNDGVYSNLIRTISYYSKQSQPSGAFNTDMFTNLYTGFTAGENKDGDGDPQSTKSQWEQNWAEPLEINFAGSTTWQTSITESEDAMKAAFRGVEEFNAFVRGYVIEHANDIESMHEAFNRMCLVNKIAGVVAQQDIMTGSVINLTTEFNNYYGTNYTSEQLRSTYLKEFAKFFVATVKGVSDRLLERSTKYHWAATKANGHSILRHTPKAEQKIYLYADLFRRVESDVFPEIFHDNYLKLDNYESIEFWQSNAVDADRPKISCYPAVLDTTTGLQKKGDKVDLSYVVGCIFDTDALMTQVLLEKARTTGVEARKGYRNTWLTFLRNSIQDITQNSIIFIMEDDNTVRAKKK